MKLESLITSLFLVLVAVDIFTTKTVKPQPVVPPKEEQSEQPMEQQETASDDASEYEGSGELPVLIDIAYCNKTGLHPQYEELEKQIYLAYPRMRNLEITKLAYPIPESAQQMSQMVTYTQYGVMAVLFLHKQLFGMIGIPVPPIVEKLVEKKIMVIAGVFILSSYVQNQFTTTGGFRVSVDSRVIYDRVGQVNVQEVLQYIKNEINIHKQ